MTSCRSCSSTSFRAPVNFLGSDEPNFLTGAVNVGGAWTGSLNGAGFASCAHGSGETLLFFFFPFRLRSDPARQPRTYSSYLILRHLLHSPLVLVFSFSAEGLDSYRLCGWESPCSPAFYEFTLLRNILSKFM